MPNRMGKVLQGGGRMRRGGMGGKVYQQQAPLMRRQSRQTGGNVGQQLPGNVNSVGIQQPTRGALLGRRRQIQSKMRDIFLNRLNQGLPDYLFQGQRQDYLRGLQTGRSNLQSMLARSGDQTGFAPAAALGFENAGALGLSDMNFQQRKMQYEDPLEQVLRWRQSKRGGGRPDSPTMGPDIGGMLAGVGAIAQGVGSFSGNNAPPSGGDTYSNDFMGPLPKGGRFA